MEDLYEALAGEGGFVGLVGVVGAEEGVGGLADDGVAGFGREVAQIDFLPDGGLERDEDVGGDGVGTGLADERGRAAFGFPTDVGVPVVGREFG